MDMSNALKNFWNRFSGKGATSRVNLLGLCGVALSLVLSPLATLSASEPVSADLGLQEVELSAPSALQMLYEPFSGLPAMANMRLDIRNVSQRQAEPEELNKRYELRIATEQNSAFNLALGTDGVLPFTVTATDAFAFEQREQFYLHSIAYGVGSPKLMQLSYRVLIPEHIWAASGTFTRTLEISLVNVVDKSDVLASTTLEVSALVNAKLQTNLAGQVSSFEEGVDVAIVDFGTLETGETKRLFIQVRGNAKALISLTSENRGQMVHTLNPKWKVNYSITVDGQFSELSSPLEIERPVKRNFSGSAYPMDITIGDVKNSFAGKYRDVITIDVNPL